MSNLYVKPTPYVLDQTELVKGSYKDFSGKFWQPIQNTTDVVITRSNGSLNFSTPVGGDLGERVLNVLKFKPLLYPDMSLSPWGTLIVEAKFSSMIKGSTNTAANPAGFGIILQPNTNENIYQWCYIAESANSTKPYIKSNEGVTFAAGVTARSTAELADTFVNYTAGNGIILRALIWFDKTVNSAYIEFYYSVDNGANFVACGSINSGIYWRSFSREWHTKGMNVMLGCFNDFYSAGQSFTISDFKIERGSLSRLNY